MNSSNTCFRKGFYLIRKYNLKPLLEIISIDDFPNLMFDDTDENEIPYQNVGDLLQGSCNLFALALHNRFGYNVYEIVDDHGILIHVFCIIDSKYGKAYVDVRGITTEDRQFKQSLYISSKREYSSGLRDITEDAKFEGKWDKLGYDFANAVIDKYFDYYHL